MPRLAIINCSGDQRTPFPLKLEMKKKNNQTSSGRRNIIWDGVPSCNTLNGFYSFLIFLLLEFADYLSIPLNNVIAMVKIYSYWFYFYHTGTCKNKDMAIDEFTAHVPCKAEMNWNISKEGKMMADYFKSRQANFKRFF